MENKSKSLIPLGLLAVGVIVVIVILAMRSTDTETAGPEGTSPPPASGTQGPATGSAADVKATFLAEGIEDQSTFSLEEGDTMLVTSDSEAIDGVAKSYDETKF